MSLCFESILYLSCNFIQLFSLRLLEITRRKFKSEAVSKIARKDVQVNVENILHRGLSVRQKEIYSFALHATLTQGGGKTLRHAKHLRSFLFSQASEISGMSIWDNKQMPGINRLNIHKGCAQIISINKAGLRLAS